MDEMAWKVQCEPATAEHPGLQATRVGDRNHEHAVRRQQGSCAVEVSARIAQMFQ